MEEELIEYWQEQLIASQMAVQVALSALENLKDRDKEDKLEELEDMN